jgi:hypothetical protein
MRKKKLFIKILFVEIAGSVHDANGYKWAFLAW